MAQVQLADVIQPDAFTAYQVENSMVSTQQTIRKDEQNWEAWLVFFLKTMAKQKDNLAAKVKEGQVLRASLLPIPAKSWSS